MDVSFGGHTKEVPSLPFVVTDHYRFSQNSVSFVAGQTCNSILWHTAEMQEKSYLGDY